MKLMKMNQKKTKFNKNKNFLKTEINPTKLIKRGKICWRSQKGQNGTGNGSPDTGGFYSNS